MDYSPKPLAPHVLMDKVRVFLEMERHRQATQCALAELSRSELELQRSNDAQCIALLTLSFPPRSGQLDYAASQSRAEAISNSIGLE